MRTRSHRKDHDIADAVKQAVAIVAAMTLAALMLLVNLPVVASATPTTTAHVSSCWRVPFKPHLPTELQCQLENYQP